ncbi:MAG: CDP-glycerol glycerophosphotransferase family protein [Rhodothermia bacterium]
MRLILHSGLVEELQKDDLSVAVLVPKLGSAESVRLRDRYGVEVLELPNLNRLANQNLELLRRYLFEDVAGNFALRARHERVMAGTMSKAKFRVSALYLVNRLVHPIPGIRTGLERVQRRFYRNAEVAEMLKNLAPRIVVSTYPANPLEGVVLAESARSGILTVIQLLSWDNITSKGHFTVLGDRFVTWGPIMTDEIKEFYNVDDSDIAEVGVPHFDAHMKAATPERIAAERQRLGLPTDQPYIFFGMSSPFIAPTEIDIVEALADRTNADEFGPEMHLLVRPHPQNLYGNMADHSWISRLDAMKGPRVVIDYPSIIKGSLPWMMQEEDLFSLGNLLSGAAVTVNSGSTLSIDAMIHDRPVVLTAFDLGEELPWWQSASRGIKFTHNAKLVALKGLRVAGSFDELMTHLKAYIENPRLDEEGREASRRMECGPCDGQSVTRTADAFHRWLQTTARQ